MKKEDYFKTILDEFSDLLSSLEDKIKAKGSLKIVDIHSAKTQYEVLKEAYTNLFLIEDEEKRNEIHIKLKKIMEEETSVILTLTDLRTERIKIMNEETDLLCQIDQDIEIKWDTPKENVKKE